MRKLLFFFVAGLFIACNSKQQEVVTPDEEEEPQDSTIYGVCSDIKGSTLQLVTTMNDTLEFVIGDEDMEHTTIVNGGMMKGDRMAITAHKVDNKMWADRVINITSILGEWENESGKITLTEDGMEWRILNGNIVHNKDTFSLYNLTADSLELENKDGIYLFKRKNN